MTNSNALRIAVVALFVAGLAVSTGCSRKKYIEPVEARPGEPRETDPRVRETDSRAPYAVDVPVEE